MPPLSPYDEWIATYRSRGESIVGRCRPVCELMQLDFPELVLHGGYVRTPLGQDTHYWLVTPDGHIVDPTAAQFGGLDLEDYEDAGTTDAMVLLERFLVRR
jgi:hypothetical protein